MRSENINKNNTKNHSIVSVSKKTFPQENLEKLGLLTKFLNWIARGANESNMGGTSCPA